MRSPPVSSGERSPNGVFIYFSMNVLRKQARGEGECWGREGNVQKSSCITAGVIRGNDSKVLWCRRDKVRRQGKEW